MTNEKLEGWYQRRQDAIVRLFRAWIDTRAEDAGKETYEELERAVGAFTLVHEAMKSEHY